MLSFFDLYLGFYILLASKVKYQLHFSSMMQTFSQKLKFGESEMSRLRKNIITVYKYVNSIHQMFTYIFLSGRNSSRHHRVQKKIHLTVPVLVIHGI